MNIFFEDFSGFQVSCITIYCIKAYNKFNEIYSLHLTCDTFILFQQCVKISILTHLSETQKKCYEKIINVHIVICLRLVDPIFPPLPNQLYAMQQNPSL